MRFTNNLYKIFFSCLIALSFICNIGVSSALADTNNYSVIFRSGSKGTFEDGSSKVTNSCEYGTSYDKILPEVYTDENSLYYFKGWNYEIPDIVTGRKEFVAKYGVIIDAVEYVVEYVDSTGVQIATPVIRKGNLGDTITSYAKEIEGYVANEVSKDTVLTEDSNIKFVYKSDKTESANNSNSIIAEDNEEQEVNRITVVEKVYQTVEESSDDSNNSNSSSNNTITSNDTSNNANGQADNNQSEDDNIGQNSNDSSSINEDLENNNNSLSEDVNNSDKNADKDNDVLSDDVVTIEDEEIPTTSEADQTSNSGLLIWGIVIILVISAILTGIIMTKVKRI